MKPPKLTFVDFQATGRDVADLTELPAYFGHNRGLKLIRKDAKPAPGRAYLYDSLFIERVGNDDWRLRFDNGRKYTVIDQGQIGREYIVSEKERIDTEYVVRDENLAYLEVLLYDFALSQRMIDFDGIVEDLLLAIVDTVHEVLGITDDCKARVNWPEETRRVLADWIYARQSLKKSIRDYIEKEMWSREITNQPH
jgi:hypothetical protein